MATKSPRKKLVKAADDAMSKFVRARDKRCVTCFGKDKLTAGHLITRAKYSIRWDERNVFCQCRSCNLKHEYYPEIFTAWWVHEFGLEAYDKLILDGNQLKKFSNDDLKEIAEEFINKLMAT